MVDVNTLIAENLQGLSKGAVTEVSAVLLMQVMENTERLSAQQAAIAAKDEHISRRDQAFLPGLIRNRVALVADEGGLDRRGTCNYRA